MTSSGVESDRVPSLVAVFNVASLEDVVQVRALYGHLLCNVEAVAEQTGSTFAARCFNAVQHLDLQRCDDEQ